MDFQKPPPELLPYGLRALKAVAGLESILPKEKEARMKALSPLVDTMPKADLDQLIAELFKGYVQ